jgi:ferredoxin-NADP reductase
VKRADGPGSKYFHDRVQVGDLLQVGAPRGSFTLAPGSNPVVLLSAGIGATPVLSMLHSLAADLEHRMQDMVVLWRQK